MRGSIIKRGASWRLIFDVPATDGKRRQRTVTVRGKRAAEFGSITRNPAATAKPPRVEQREIEILEPAQIEQLMAGLEGHPLHTIAQLALATGARRGELLALEWATWILIVTYCASSARSKKLEPRGSGPSRQKPDVA